MILRDEIAEILHDELLRGAATYEKGALDSLLDDLTEKKISNGDRIRIEVNSGCYAAALAEAAFMVGFEMGAHPRGLLCKSAVGAA